MNESIAETLGYWGEFIDLIGCYSYWQILMMNFVPFYVGQLRDKGIWRPKCRECDGKCRGIF